MQRVVVDANVVVSFVVHRNERQRELAKALFSKAEDGDVEAMLPQFVIFEIAYVLQSTYGFREVQLAELIRDLLALPGVEVVNDCPWRRILEVWPHPLSDLADAAIVAVALANRYDAVATFDRKLANKLDSFAIAPYW